MTQTLLSLCTGSGADIRGVLGGLGAAGLPRLPWATAWTGRKDPWIWRWWQIRGIDPDASWRCVVVDPGPCGRTWKAIVDGPARVCAILRSWEGQDPGALWVRLRDAGEPTDPDEWVASWLWLQARSVCGAPVWWEDGFLLQAGPGHRVKRATQRGPPRADGSEGGMRSPGTVAGRLEAIASHVRGRVEVHLIPAEAMEPIPGAVVCFDPPYLNATRYADVMPRPVVLETCRRHAEVSRVLVCERERLDLPGWEWHDVTMRPDRREWVGVSP
jgi:hypothetical protein